MKSSKDMKPIKEILDIIVDNNIKLPTCVWFKHRKEDIIHHIGIITSVIDNKVVINYQDGKSKTCLHKMFIHVNHSEMVLELDEQLNEEYLNG